MHLGQRFEMKGKIAPVLLAALALSFPHTSAVAKPLEPQDGSQQNGVQEILSYISSGWDGLRRSMTECESIQGGWLKMDPPVLYLPADIPMPAAVETLQEACSVQVERLPAVINAPGEIDLSHMEGRALLYLEHPYVVPGGQFNEMYGWDSYFILRGLLREGRISLARGMVENFFFEMDHYGMILNANRAYFLQRSQPPFLSSMVMAVHEAQKAAGKEDREWLERAHTYIVRDYEMWVRAPHLAGDTGLSRYYGLGEGVTPDMLANKSAVGDFSYVVSYLLRHPEEGGEFLARASDAGDEAGSTAEMVGPVYSLQLCNPGTEAPSGDECEQVENVGLTADFYKGDESMRESGFDISFRFGPFSGATHHYAPVGLNSLLYKAEKDLQRISRELGRETEAEKWTKRARIRRGRMQKYLWDNERGFFFDYDFEKGIRSTYDYLTAFYPLWVGVASPEQDRRLVSRLPLFEQAGGLAMSRRETKAQWDFPYGWAPAHLIVVEGLRRYGYEDDANRISYKFLSMVLENFRRDGTIREKYDVVTRSTETRVETGYATNVIGFGWTNGVFLELLRLLPEEAANRLAQE